ELKCQLGRFERLRQAAAGELELGLLGFNRLSRHDLSALTPHGVLPLRSAPRAASLGSSKTPARQQQPDNEKGRPDETGNVIHHSLHPVVRSSSAKTEQHVENESG